MARNFRVQDAYEEVTVTVTGTMIKVRAMPTYLEDQSSPEDSYYVWAYTIEIENHGTETIRLRSRLWRITDANGQVKEVSGMGVVGAQPFIGPGDIYTYTSGVPLPTPSGIMKGYYRMQDRKGNFFAVRIPTFSLDSPFSGHQLH